MNKNLLKKVISIVGSQALLAKAIGVKQPAISHWLHRDKNIPAEYAIKIERATNGAVTRYELRPDIYPPDEH